jgi:hypothetical protein
MDGSDTRFAFTEGYDDYGQARRQTQIACARGVHEQGSRSGLDLIA